MMPAMRLPHAHVPRVSDASPPPATRDKTLILKGTLMKTLSGLIIVLAMASGMATSSLFSPAESSSGSAQEATAQSEPSSPLIVHEWGTFTTFSGSNGVHLDFRPLLDHELPYFVMDRAEQAGTIWLGKGRIRSRVRMETPVTYFYTDVERTVTARVRFPKGMLTEFYPPVREMAPAYDLNAATRGDGEPIADGLLDWGAIELIPASSLRPGVKDPKAAEWLQEVMASRILPEANGNHYALARETDSAFVYSRWPGVDLPEWIETPSQSPSGAVKYRPGHHIEKFLFYRGVGQFDVPVQVTTDDKDRVAIANKGSHPISGMLLLTVNGDQLRMVQVPDCATGDTQTVVLPKEPIGMDELRIAMIERLVAAGLFEKEATAMVNTWQDSWFTEQGTRLFYLVPQQTTDALLPLEISPVPDKTVRVMVGRVEIMSATQEQQLMAVLKRSAQDRKVAWAKAAEEKSPVAPTLPVPVEFITLGRMAEPALARLQAIAKQREVADEAELLLNQLRSENR